MTMCLLRWQLDDQDQADLTPSGLTPRPRPTPDISYLNVSISIARSIFPITNVAIALPSTLTGTNADDSSRCTPRISPTLATGIVPVADSVDASTTMAEPATPAPPLDVASRIASSPNCCPIERLIPTACARNTDTLAKYRQVPSWLKP